MINKIFFKKNFNSSSLDALKNRKIENESVLASLGEMVPSDPNMKRGVANNLVKQALESAKDIISLHLNSIIMFFEKKHNIKKEIKSKSQLEYIEKLQKSSSFKELNNFVNHYISSLDLSLTTVKQILTDSENDMLTRIEFENNIFKLVKSNYKIFFENLLALFKKLTDNLNIEISLSINKIFVNISDEFVLMFKEVIYFNLVFKSFLSIFKNFQETESAILYLTNNQTSLRITSLYVIFP